MWNEEEGQQEDTLVIGRGIFFGILFGSILWALIIGAVVYFFK